MKVLVTGDTERLDGLQSTILDSHFVMLEQPVATADAIRSFSGQAMVAA